MKTTKENIIDGQTIALITATILMVGGFITFIICEGSCLA